MPKKQPGRLALLNSEIMRKAAELKGDNQINLGVVAGVANRYRLRHTDIGTGVILMGEFKIVRYEGEDVVRNESAQALILPMDVGTKIAKKLKEGKKQIKFCLAAKLKGSAVLVQGYAVSTEWIYEPVELGQADLVNEMLENSRPAPVPKNWPEVPEYGE